MSNVAKILFGVVFLLIAAFLIFTNVADYEESVMDEDKDLEDKDSNEEQEEGAGEEDMIYISQEQELELDLSVMNFDGTLTCPAIIEGQISGTWYNEGEFSIEVLQDGQVVEQLRAEAQEEWMTEEPVMFTSTFECQEYSGQLDLVFQQANPSGLAENDDQVVVTATIEGEEDREAQDAGMTDDFDQEENNDSSLY